MTAPLHYDRIKVGVSVYQCITQSRNRVKTVNNFKEKIVWKEAAAARGVPSGKSICCGIFWPNENPGVHARYETPTLGRADMVTGQ